MKRYAVCFLSQSTGSPIVLSETDSPLEAYHGALQAQKEGFGGVRVADLPASTSHEPQVFKTMHRL